MVATADPRAQAPSERTRGVARALRLGGWTLITAGSVVLLYVVYLLLFTGVATDRAQARLLDEWQGAVGSSPTVDDAGGQGTADDTAQAPAEPGDAGGVDGPAAVPSGAGAVAMLEFHRPGSDERPVRDDPLLVVTGVTAEQLRAGPGHYPETSLPGGEGNFAVAGHRTTYGAPFFRLDELEPGDEVHVTDRAGRRHRYRVASTEIVGPGDVWVLDGDPLGAGRPTLTLTTCHPRFSAAQRLVVFGELVS